MTADIFERKPGFEKSLVLIVDAGFVFVEHDDGAGDDAGK